MRVLYGTNPIGLGHATRDIVVAREMLRRRPMEICFLSGPPASKFLEEHGFPFLSKYSPPRFDSRDGRVRAPGLWFLKFYRFFLQSQKIASSVLERERPDFVVSDEDLGLAEAANLKGIPSVLMTDVEDVHLDRARIIARRMNRGYQRILERQRKVIIPDHGLDEGNRIHCGPICRPFSDTRMGLRHKFNFTKSTVLCTVGGSDAGRFLMRRTVQAFRNLGRGDLELVIASGPSAIPPAPGPGIRVVGFQRNLQDLILAADVLITLAGKSTIDEALAAGTPLIAIPIANHFEQVERASKLGFVPEDVDRLERLMVEKLKEPRGPTKRYGAEKCVDEILSNAPTDSSA